MKRLKDATKCHQKEGRMKFVKITAYKKEEVVFTEFLNLTAIEDISFDNETKLLSIKTHEYYKAFTSEFESQAFEDFLISKNQEIFQIDFDLENQVML